MGIIPRVTLVIFLFFSSTFLRSEENIISLTTDDPLIKQAIEKAPYFKHKIDIYLHRLSADDNPTPLIRELTAQLRHFCPGANLIHSPHQSSEALLQKNQTGSQTETIPLKVNNTDSTCWNASVAFSDVSNTFLIVWQDERSGANNPDIYGQYFNHSLEPIGSNFRVHSATSGVSQSTPAVAATSDGGFVVTWEDYREGKPTIFYRGFDASRTARGPEAKADSAQNKDQYFPAITADNLGYFTIAWLQDDDGDFNIYSRKFSNSGQGLRLGFKVNTDNQYLQWAPSVASSVTGEALIVWEDKRNGNSDIFGQRMRADGTRQAGNFRINDADAGSIQWRPFVASRSGQFVACWEDYRLQPDAISAQWFDSSMLTVGSNVRIDDADNAGLKEYPAVAINSSKQSLFTWQDGRNGNWEIYARWGNADRVPQNLFTLNDGSLTGDQTQPKVVLGDSLSTFVWLGELSMEENQHVYAAQYGETAVPVELCFFRSVVKANDVYLEWGTLTESNNLGFEIQRKTRDNDFEKISFIRGKGTTVSDNSYSYLDKDLFPGTYTYRLKQMDYDGECSFSNLAEVVVHGPSQFFISQNYPNPFNPTTTIHYSLPNAENVKIEIYDVNGTLVRTLTSGMQAAGNFTVIWDRRDDAEGFVSSGVYLYRIQAGSFTMTKKMIVLK